MRSRLMIGFNIDPPVRTGIYPKKKRELEVRRKMQNGRQVLVRRRQSEVKA